jgi:hypothetical protein
MPCYPEQMYRNLVSPTPADSAGASACQAFLCLDLYIDLWGICLSRRNCAFGIDRRGMPVPSGGRLPSLGVLSDHS